MGEKLIKPYEISVWEDRLTQIEGSDPVEYKFEEIKLAIIGSDTMVGFNKIYNPVFNKKANGERTLSFALKYKYFDPFSGNEEVINPFAALLINERKVKLHYDNEWYEFIVKDHTESSDGLEWTYTCNDAFVIELSKQGYNLTFDSELQNNQGTAEELAKKVLENTDWQLKEANPGKQLIAEPIYKAQLVGNADIINVSDTEDDIPTPTADIYVFYSYVKNKSGKFVQFIIRDKNRKYIIDDRNVITDTNFRILTDLTYDESTQTFKDINGNNIIQLENQVNNEEVNPIEVQYQANRLVYNQLTTYDSVMQRTVDRFKVDDREIYKYTDYLYTTSDVVMNYITNGDNFNALDDGTLQGWNPYVDSTDKVKPLELITKPELSSETKLVDLGNLFQIEGFLKARFNGARTDVVKESEEADDAVYVLNTIFNSGIENHDSFIKNISKGDEFVFRWRAGQGDFQNLQPTTSLRMIVAKYAQDKPTWGYYYKHIKQEDIVIEFTGSITEDNILNNYIEGGVLKTIEVDGVTKHNYVIDDVVQTPSTKYIYKVNDIEYVWDAASGDFVLKNSSNFLPYYYLKATAIKSVSSKELDSSDSHYGIFIYTVDDSLTEEVVIEESFVEEEEEEEIVIEEPVENDEEVEGNDDEGEVEESDYPQQIQEELESKKGTQITVSYIDNADIIHSYSFTAGTNNIIETCTYNAEKDSIKIVDATGIKSYRITYYTVSPIYIQDIQFTRYIPNVKNNSIEPVLMGNVPTANSEPINYYYLKPEDGEAAEDIKTYSSLNELEDDLGLVQNSIKPLYNENSEKNLTISASQSNCFNILQTIAETFECWVELEVDHDEQGRITYTNNKPNKYVSLKEFVGKENWAGFKYGINLQSIERNINSDEIVTKLIVDQSQSDLVDEGYVSISNAPSNSSGESYVLNFDYYYNQGLLDRDNTEADRLKFITAVADLNKQIQEKEVLRRNYEMSMLQLDAKRTDYSLLIESAQNMRNEALENFEKYTGKTYEEYQQEHNDIVDGKSRTDSFVPTSAQAEAITNIFTLEKIPRSKIEMSVSAPAWEQTVQFIGGKSSEISSEVPGETIAVGDSIYKDAIYNLSFLQTAHEVDEADVIETYEANTDNFKQIVWNINSFINTDVWSTMPVGEPFIITVWGIQHANHEGIDPIERDIGGNLWHFEFKKGEDRSLQDTGRCNITYNAEEETITYKLINYNGGDSYYLSAQCGRLTRYTYEPTNILPSAEVTLTIEKSMALDNPEEVTIPISISKDETGENDLVTYQYDSSTGIISLVAKKQITIKSYYYKTIRTISFDGDKKIKFYGYPLGNQEITCTYVPSLEDLLTEEETIFDLLGELYASSSTINNYSGILTNVGQEYWDVRKKLRGSENYTVKVWFGIDVNQQKHIFVSLNDYLQNVQFYLGDEIEPYQSSLSEKYFDIPVNNNITEVRFIAPTNYYFKDGDNQLTEKTITVKETKTTLNIICNETVDGVEDIIKELQEEKDALTTDFNNKYSRFIQEGTWNSTDYIDAEHYYLDAVQVSNTSAQPTVSYTIGVVEISQLEGLELYQFDTGDKTYIEDTEFFGWSNVGGVLTPAREEVIVSEVEWHLDEPENNIITVQNYKTRFEDLFQRISAAIQTVQYNEATYAKISSLLDADGTINQDVLLTSLNRISGKRFNLTSDGSILINGDQILVQNLNNFANRVIINSEGIQVSSDGGATWRTAINGEGINAGLVRAGSLNTNEVIIGNNNYPSFRWDKAGISAYKSTSQTLEEDGQTIDVYDLQTYVRYDQYGLYGVKDGGTFKANSLQDVLNKAHFAVTWDGFFIKNSYEDGGRVSITSDNDFQVIDGNEIERVKIGSLGVNPITNERIYGINISNQNGDSVLSTNNNGDLTISGTIYANAGEIGGMSVDNTRLRMDHIVFEPGTGIYSDWGESSVYPFIISDKDGSATFNNVVVRGSIKTSVFEYEEIQAVGGAFMFRPSTAIKTAMEDNGDLILTVEKPLILRDGAWYKLSNYNSDDTIDADELTTYGLTHIYQLNKTKVNDETEIRLIGGAAILQTINIDDIPGGSIIDMGFEPNTYRPINLIEESSPVALHLYELVNGEYVLTSDVTVISGKTYYKEWYQAGINNYGIGINSSDNYINLPPRAISLFETIVDHTQDPKVSYKYRGILGTLPQMRYSGNNPQVSELYHNYLEGTQGIYTDNMYLGDKEQYIAFYEDSNGNKQLKIKANQVMYEIVDEETGESEWKDVQDTSQGLDGEDAITVSIDSSAGNVFLNKHIQTTLTCTVTKGNGTDITNQVTRFTWTKKNADGTIDSSWSRPLAGRSITLTDADVNSKAVFVCEVEF